MLSLLWETLIHMLLFAVLISMSKFGLLHILESSRVCHPLTVPTAAPLRKPPFNMTVIVYQFLPLKPDDVSPAPNPPTDSCLLRINAKTWLHSTLRDLAPACLLITFPTTLPTGNCSFPEHYSDSLHICFSSACSILPHHHSSLTDFRGPSWISAHSSVIIIILTHPILFWPKHLSPLNIKWGAFRHLSPVCQAPLDYKLQEGLRITALQMPEIVWKPLTKYLQVRAWVNAQRVDSEYSLKYVQLEVSPNS